MKKKVYRERYRIEEKKVLEETKPKKKRKSDK